MAAAWTNVTGASTWAVGEAAGKVSAARSQAKKDFSNADTDGDGVISWDEFWQVAG